MMNKKNKTDLASFLSIQRIGWYGITISSILCLSLNPQSALAMYLMYTEDYFKHIRQDKHSYQLRHTHSDHITVVLAFWSTITLTAT